MPNRLGSSFCRIVFAVGWMLIGVTAPGALRAELLAFEATLETTARSANSAFPFVSVTGSGLASSGLPATNLLSKVEITSGLVGAATKRVKSKVCRHYIR